LSAQEKIGKPLVSVIIPTYNSEKTLAKCLESIKNQSCKDIEIIVVDKFSGDKTVEIAKSYGAIVFQLNAERAEAKNFALRKAVGEYVCFIDSDMELTKNVIEECVNLIKKNGKIGGIIIPERSVGNSFWVKVRDFERSFYAGTEIESARFFRKDVVEKTEGFDEHIIFFEESTLPQKIERLGYNVKARINAEILHHEEDFSVWKWLKKKFYYGNSIANYKEKYSDYASKQLSTIYRISIFLKNKRFYSKPLNAAGIIFLKFLEYFSIVLGFSASKAEKMIRHLRSNRSNEAGDYQVD
jgi:glycosyltransferase involved in cell wall biosynthesis